MDSVLVLEDLGVVVRWSIIRESGTEFFVFEWSIVPTSEYFGQFWLYPSERGIRTDHRVGRSCVRWPHNVCVVSEWPRFVPCPSLAPGPCSRGARHASSYDSPPQPTQTTKRHHRKHGAHETSTGLAQAGNIVGNTCKMQYSQPVWGASQGVTRAHKGSQGVISSSVKVISQRVGNEG